MTEPTTAAGPEHELQSKHSRLSCKCGSWETGSFAEDVREVGGIAWATPETQTGRDLQIAAAGAGAQPAALDWWGKRILAVEAEAHQQNGSALCQHGDYDCGGKGHGSDVNEVQWCHDCSPHPLAALPPSAPPTLDESALHRAGIGCDSDCFDGGDGRHSAKPGPIHGRHLARLQEGAE